MHYRRSLWGCMLGLFIVVATCVAYLNMSISLRLQTFYKQPTEIYSDFHNILGMQGRINFLRVDEFISCLKSIVGLCANDNIQKVFSIDNDDSLIDVYVSDSGNVKLYVDGATDEVRSCCLANQSYEVSANVKDFIKSSNSGYVIKEVKDGLILEKSFSEV